MKANAKNKKTGFTLIELLIALALIAIVLPAVTTAFMDSIKNTKDESSKLDTITQARSIIQTLNQQGKFAVDGLYNKTALAKTGDALIITITYDDIVDISGSDGLLSFHEPNDEQYVKKMDTNINSNTISLGTNYKAVITIVPSNYYLKGALQSFSFYKNYRVDVIVSDLKNGELDSKQYAYIGG